MTISREWILAPADLHSVSIKCNECGTRLSVPLGSKKARFPADVERARWECPGCGEAFFSDVKQAEAIKNDVRDLGNILARLEGHAFIHVQEPLKKQESHDLAKGK